MVSGKREARPAAEDTDSDDTSSASEGQRSPPVTAEKRIAKKPTSSGSETEDSGSDFPTKTRSKPNHKTVASPFKTPTKRTAAAAVEGEKGSKKLRKKGAEDEGKNPVLYKRLWSDEDEIVILNGMLDYEKAKGADPMADANDFHDFIRKSLHFDADLRQLKDKVRGLRRRYNKSVGKNKFFTSHEEATFKLSKMIWGNEVPSIDAVKSNVKTGKAEISGSGQQKTASSWQFIGKTSISMGLNENVVKVGLQHCEEDKKAQVEEKWRQLHLEESDLFSRKLELAREESKMIIEAFRSER